MQCEMEIKPLLVNALHYVTVLFKQQRVKERMEGGVAEKDHSNTNMYRHPQLCNIPVELIGNFFHMKLWWNPFLGPVTQNFAR